MSSFLRSKEMEFIGRDYQNILAEQAYEENKILYLPTGSGKTFIAIMVLKRLFYLLEPEFSQGGKRAVFLVNTVALVDQQAEVLKRHLCVEEVGRYSGDMNLDFWNKSVWVEEFTKHQVMVMTAEILNQLLLKKYIGLNNLALIILDECHHAVEDHPMRQIMKLFEDCSKIEQPRVIGLTATLLNGTPKSVPRVPEEVKKLEVTLHSTIATVNSWEVVKQFSTKPKEKYAFFHDNALNQYLMHEVGYLVDKMNETCRLFNFVTDQTTTVALIPGFIPMKGGKKTEVTKLLAQVSKQLGWLGPYGCSKTLIAVYNSLRLIQQKMVDRNSHLMIQSVNCLLFRLSQSLESEMKGEFSSESQKIIKHSSPKVILLLDKLEEHYQKCISGPECEREPLQALIFVEEKMTAKILCSVLKNIARSETFSFLKPAFMVGGSYNPFTETWEGMYNKQQNDAIVQRFRDGDLNVLVCTDVLEEGIDIPLCNMVVRFDLVKTFRSYVQSKGRARHKKSSFILMAPIQEQGPYFNKIRFFEEIEEALEILLVGSTDDRISPSESELDELYEAEIPPYYTPEGSKITLTSAIQLLNNYCLYLAHDRFSKISPSWHVRRSQGKMQVAVQLPKLSPLQKEVIGPLMATIKIAKRAAALETCKELHLCGVLNDFLVPTEKCLEEEEMHSLLPLWEHEEKDVTPKSGTHQKIRRYLLQRPSCWEDCYPTPGKNVFLHEIQIYPSYEKPSESDSRKAAVFSALSVSRHFVIVSSKPLPMICQFPVFAKFGAMNIKIMPAKQVKLSEEEIMQVLCFHFNLFTSMIPIAKKFVVFSRRSFLIAPSSLDKFGNFQLDWAAMKVNATKVETTEDFLSCVVIPVHRGISSPSESYFVTRVCELNSLSKFPNGCYKTYADYFSKKHGFKVKDVSLPLLEVQPINSISNDLKPRLKMVTQDKDDSSIHFPVEACEVKHVDGCLFLKACLLPSILHRLERLFLANELQKEIASGINNLVAPQVENCKELGRIQNFTIKTKDVFCSAGLANISLSPVVKNKPSPVKCQTLKPWKQHEEPVDIEHNFDTVSIEDIDKYGAFMNHKVSAKTSAAFRDTCKKTSNTWKLPPLQKGEGAIKLLVEKSVKISPHPCLLYEATTAAAANDIVNLERLETLGDSFLKFAVSFVLLNRFPNLQEGKLTQIKGQILGNRNLYYCAKGKDLGAYLKFQEIVPSENWIPPCFSVPESLAKYPLRLLRNNVELSKEEQLDAMLNASTLHELDQKVSLCSKEALSDWERQSSPLNPIQNYQNISDKTIADCVESLIGAYLKSCGPSVAMLFLEYMRILPTGAASLLQNRSDRESVLACRPDNFYGCQDLETILAYKFKNKSLLSEALTHASSPSKSNTYERLEFIGDAVLDFLITAYIFENGGELSPGQLTDLRSSLVNNVTFACLTVRYGFYKHLNAGSPALLEAIDRFVRFQEQREHVIDEEVLILLEESECRIAETVDVPKALGDLFEAIIGGIFIDSGMSFSVVWGVVYRLMKNEIRNFSQNVPKQIVRRVYETFGSENVDFRLSKATQEIMMMQVFVILTISFKGNKKTYNGFGVNKAQAKKSAAKLALRDTIYMK